MVALTGPRPQSTGMALDRRPADVAPPARTATCGQCPSGGGRLGRLLPPDRGLPWPGIARVTTMVRAWQEAGFHNSGGSSPWSVVQFPVRGFAT